ncbi:MAG TPA: replication initiator, partial [Streptosporangiaceae bacterium]|nr:replication initiator [Streptosporangiaceae bacterium]
IAKYATKTINAAGLPDEPVHSAADIDALACSQHYKRLIATAWDLGKDPAAAQLGLNRWTHTLGYRGHSLTKSRRYSVTFTALRRARINYRHTQRHPSGRTGPLGPPPRRPHRADRQYLGVRRNWARRHRRTRARLGRGRPGPRTRTHRARGDLDELTNPRRRSLMDKLLYRPKEAAVVLGISKTVLYGLIRANRIRSIKDGKFRFITADALREYVRTLEREYEEAS